MKYNQVMRGQAQYFHSRQNFTQGFYYDQQEIKKQLD